MTFIPHFLQVQKRGIIAEHTFQETEVLSTEGPEPDEDDDDEEDLPGAKLPAAAGRGNVPNEKIAIWLKDCR
nr:sperm-specific antigen 2 homolog [Cavia porcellus]